MDGPSDRDGGPDVADRRTEQSGNWFVEHFCPVCGCAKSGRAEVPNTVTDWCQDRHCPCHGNRDERLESGASGL
jgi:hypothetical protein